ncbi:hypothetical protein AB3M83_12420 [Microbacterium sp. 179-B 1A2 NHS]|uniref:hypothetical protein n=1 Tax=Microbacterium sp. 179-B 1A2 NHS TaxID=3142383 RepID=UPI0039A0751C
MRSSRFSGAASVLLAALTLTACANGAIMPSPSSSSSGSARPPFQTTTPGPLGPTGSPTVPDATWAAIDADLAARGITGTPDLVSAEAVTFTDGSLGCPKPGRSYTQALVDGMRIVVRVDGVTYDYRVGGGDPRLCER